MIVAAHRLHPAVAVPSRATGVLEFVPVGTRTVVSRAYAESPLRLLTPANHGDAAWVFTSTYGGGLVGGDAVSIAVDVAAGASAALLTQASTKIYRSPLGSTFRLSGRVADDALLVVLPDPVAPFAGSRYDQHQSFALDERGALVLLDWFTCGRAGFGERWAFDRYASRLEVTIGGRPVLVDATCLDAADGEIGDRFGRFNVMAAAVVAGVALAPRAAEIARRVAAMPHRRRADVLISAAAIAGGGCVIRAAGTAAETIGRTLRALLDFVPVLLGDNPWLRKW